MASAIVEHFPPSKSNGRLAVVVDGLEEIPAWVQDLDSFRNWARSGQFPRRGRFSYLGGTLWADLTMEQLFTHNQVKGEFAVVIGGLVKKSRRGRFFHDRALLSHPGAELSSEPDGMYVEYESIRKQRVRLIEGAASGHVEVEGSPDMTLEVLSESSVLKDNERLRELYWRAEIREYWIVDVRDPANDLRFDILRRGRKDWSPVRARQGWLFSEVFGLAFRLIGGVDPLGQPEFTLEIQN